MSLRGNWVVSPGILRPAPCSMLLLPCEVRMETVRFSCHVGYCGRGEFVREQGEYAAHLEPLSVVRRVVFRDLSACKQGVE